ncbi:hypothetical protein [Streptomyces sp. YGL11-2]|uniref:hypothetical protein n=1 Tax=Streptomyces sp. YGL11-2 TaxID=3414028 RepID=UPI003CF9873B
MTLSPTGTVRRDLPVFGARRPLANMKAGAFLDLKRRLLALGADPAALGLLDAAMDADRIIDAALAPPEDLDLHPLAEWVHTRDTARMIAWAVNGTPPPALRDRSPSRRGPVATAPLMGAQYRTTLFTNLREAVHAADGGDSRALLRRQALYLTSYDSSPEANSWTAHALHARRGIASVQGGSPRWAEARSTAAALARRGDPVPPWTSSTGPWPTTTRPRPPTSTTGRTGWAPCANRRPAITSWPTAR